MNPFEFRAFLDLLMCSDPYPCPTGEYTLKNFADKLSVERGFTDWIDAYHNYYEHE